MEKTFQDPAWYSETRADYPLVISAIEALRSGKLDSEYNNIGRDYLFLGELRERIMHGGPTRMGALENAAESLDKGKRYYDGYEWLEKQLFSSD